MFEAKKTSIKDQLTFFGVVKGNLVIIWRRYVICEQSALVNNVIHVLMLSVCTDYVYFLAQTP